MNTPTPHKGFKISDFEIQTSIGQGAYGEVLMAVRKKTGKNYALKIMNKEFIASKGKQIAIFRERTILTFLRHENIIRMEGSFNNEENLCLVLELIEGDELGEMVEEYDRMDPTFVQNIVRDLVSAISYMHSVGVYHGDIKPQNIMITQQHRVKLIDFGCANFFEVNSKNKEPVDAVEKFKSRMNDMDVDEFNGTAFYASPELIGGGGNSWKDDMWSLGVVVYQLLTGQLPFYADTDHLVFNKILSLEYDNQPPVRISIII